MAQVRFTTHLQKFFPTLQQNTRVSGQTVAQVIVSLDARYPGLGAYITDERGALRKHVNIFIGDELVQDRVLLSDGVDDAETLFIMQALSGG